MCASCDVNAIIRSCSSGEVKWTFPKPSERIKSRALSTFAMSSFSLGQRSIVAPWNNPARECANPEYWLPAIG